MNAIEEKRIGDYLVKVFPDDCPSNPRDDMNFGTMVCFHNRYNLGDKHDYNHNHYSGWNEMEEDIIKKEKVAVILPLYLYDHSGITMNTTGFSCPWDSGQVGFIFVSKKNVLKEFGGKKMTPALVERATKLLLGEVETYDQYLTGDVYGYRIYKVENCDKGHTHMEEIDACWGFYDKDECLNEGIADAQHYAEKEMNVV